MEDIIANCVPLAEAKLAVFNAYLQGFIDNCESLRGTTFTKETMEGTQLTCQLPGDLNESGKDLGTD